MNINVNLIHYKLFEAVLDCYLIEKNCGSSILSVIKFKSSNKTLEGKAQLLCQASMG